MKSKPTGTEIILCLCLIPVAVITRGYILSILWTWFLLPLNFPQISIPEAMGLSLVISFFRKNSSPIRENSLSTQIITNLTEPWLALLLGYIIHQFQ